MSTPTKSAQAIALERVQRRVGAIVFFSVTIHGVFGLIGVAHHLIDERRDDAIILLIMCIPMSVVNYVGVRAILARPMISVPWMIVSFTPCVAGFIWVLGYS